MLCLAGTKLIQLLTAHMVPCFAFVAKTVLVPHPWFRYCQTVLSQLPDLLSLSVCALSRWAEGGQEDGRGHRGGSWPTLVKCHTASCSAVALGKAFQKSHCSDSCWASVCCWEVVSVCLCTTSSLCLYFNPHVGFLFSPLILSPTCCRGQWARSWWVLSYGTEPTTVL